ncbi:Ig-like domain-containing protein [Cohnella zeiphila]|uniref:Ig-like domain-containing protein n=1 Tax=Cohnella zeiphila TaxID=2761120 RepID=A0A7X0SMI5_9BACL|nr:Ig-like domain-containing protein [Cohnella zeiphila]MBB6731594.1 Ig-like domain-containing protein [Cohnella zeiphila]
MLRSKAVLLMIFALLINVAALPAAQAQTESGSPDTVFYVATDGSDSNPGTLDAPFQTLEKARDAIRELKSESGLPSGGVTVYLRGGKYERSASFQLEEQDSGSADSPIKYQAYPGESVTLTGGQSLAKSWFTPVTDQAILNRIISADARTKVLQVDLRAHGITDYGVISRHGYYKANDVSQVPPMELYVDGQDMTLARWPNNGTVQMGDIVDPGPTRSDADLQDRGGTFTYTYDRPQYWTQADDIWLDGIFGYSWEWSYNKVASIDTANKTITLRYGEMSGLLKNWYPDFHFASNLLEEIDMPGEYYIDRTSGILYFLPTASFGQDAPDIAVTMLGTPMINALNVSHVTFEDLTLEDGRDSAVVVMGGDHVLVSHCEIRNFTNGGVQINTQSRWLYNDFATATGTDIGVVNSHIHHIGGTAVTLNGGDRTTLTHGNNYVEDSHIHDFAYYHKAYNPAVILTGVGNRVSHNEIHDAPHPGILVFGNDQLIEYNDIYDVCKMFSDLGAIYMNAGETPQQRGTVIRRNYFHNIGESKAGVQGVYPDNFTMGLTIDENIFYKMGNAAINNNGGAHITARNNLFVDSKTPYSYSDMYLGDDPNGQIAKNYMPKWQALFAANNNFVGTPYLDEYPELADFFTENRYYPDTNAYQNNVIYNPTVTRSSTTNAQGAYDKYNLLQYGGNWVTDHDPGFVDLAGGDLELKSDAEVFQQIPGFVSIPFDEIGPSGKVGPYLAPDSIPVQGVHAYDENVTIGIGKTYDLQTAVLPWNATNPKLHFASGDPSVVKVDDNGTLKGVNVGQAVVTIASDADPSLQAEVAVTVEAGDGIYEYTDFESGHGSWPVDPNRAVVDVDGNHLYKVLKGATALTPDEYSNYELNFKMVTPPTMPSIGTFYIFDRLGSDGGGRIGYRLENGASKWLLYNKAWGTVKENDQPGPDLAPNTEYSVKLIAKGGDLSLYVDGELKLKATDATYNPSGTVGFYAGGFDYLMFDDIKLSIPTDRVAGLLLDKTSANLGADETLQLQVSFDPSDAANREVAWTTSNPSVATVDGNGLVQAVGPGEADITVTSADNPQATATSHIVVSDVLLRTDFESGGGGWPVDPNRSIATVNGNHVYKLFKGASTTSPRSFSNYDLTFKMKTPATIPSAATLYIFDRLVSGSGDRIGYRKTVDGASQWIVYDKNWATVSHSDLAYEDLTPNTEYDVELIVNGSSIELYVDGQLKVSATDSKANASGTIGFYAGGFDYLTFDDIEVTQLRRPGTEAAVSPAEPDGANGWYIHPITVTLSVPGDASAGVKTEYSLDGGTNWQPYSSPVQLDQDGTYTISYRSSKAGIVEDAKTLEVRLDQTAPALAAAAPAADRSYADSEDLTPQFDLADALSGADPAQLQAQLDGQTVNAGEAIALYTLPLGAHTLEATASDAAGNVGSVAVAFTTRADADSLQALVAKFRSLSWIDDEGIADSLTEKLENSSLDAFVNEVQAQSGKHIAAEAAQVLLRDAQYVLQTQTQNQAQIQEQTPAQTQTPDQDQAPDPALEG